MPGLFRYFLVSVLLLSCFGSDLSAQFLFPVDNNHKYGYVNAAGDTVIPLQFDEADAFSEGLAAVRKNGYFGYIDTRGNFVIPPKLDYAERFHESRAAAYKDGKKFYIDPQGRRKFYLDPKYKTEPFHAGLMIIRDDKKYGLVDSLGRMRLKPRYLIQKENDKYYSVADSEGNHTLYSYKGFFAPFDDVYECGYNDGRTIVVEYVDKRDSALIHYSVIDQKGAKIRDIVSKDPSMNMDYLGEDLYELRQDAPEEDEEGAEQDSARGVSIIDGKTEAQPVQKKNSLHVVNGKLDTLFDASDWQSIYGFEGGVSWVSIDDNDHRIIDKKFNFVGTTTFYYVADAFFHEVEGDSLYYAIVRDTAFKYGLVDSRGKMVIPYKYAGLEFLPGNTGLLLAETEPATVVESKKKLAEAFNAWQEADAKHRADRSYTPDPALKKRLDSLRLYGASGTSKGIINYKEQPIVPYEYSWIDKSDLYGDSILRYSEGRTSGLMFTNGKIICRRTDPYRRKNQALVKCDIAWMTGGFFYARSDEDEPNSMGWSDSWNRSKKNAALPLRALGRQGIFVFVDTTLQDTVEKDFLGYPVYLVNAGTDTAFFSAEDSRLHMKVQALDKQKKWRDIEYLPNSWCGNSYHAVKLGPGSHWKFAVPQYGGARKTRLRIVLDDGGGTGMNRYWNKKDVVKKTYISNEFGGAVNPAQFFKKNERPRWDIYYER